MSHLASSSLREFQSFLKRLQVGIHKKVKLNFIAIEVKKEVEETICVCHDVQCHDVQCCKGVNP
jgi:hypothetical protein